MAARVTIDRDGCISCGICWNTAPDFFEENPDDNKSQIQAAHRTGGNIAAGEAPDNLVGPVREAEDACPVSVIHVEG